jgi:Firmicute plasmid replication protein (RepL)
MGRKRIEQRDAETGEILGGVLTYFPPPRARNGFTEGWSAMARGAGTFFAQNRSFLGQEGLALILLLIDKLDFENHLVIDKIAIGLELGMARQNVQRSVRRLIELGALIEGPKNGHSRTYRLNPNFAWRGSGENHLKALAEYREQRMQAANISGVLEDGKVEVAPAPALVSEAHQPIRPMRNHRLFKKAVR